MTKKNYMKPEMRSYQIEASSILAASSNYARPEDDPGDLYDQIPFHKGDDYCRNPE